MGRDWFKALGAGTLILRAISVKGEAKKVRSQEPTDAVFERHKELFKDGLEHCRKN